MKASELRIGNLVLADVGLPSTQVHCMTAQDILDLSNGKTADLIHPIPLTAEWLVKLGFKKTGHSFEKKYRTNYYITGFLVNDCLLISLGTALSRVNNVHQLQNLYFALTGDELTLI